MNILASGRLAIADLVCQNPAVHRIRLGASHAFRGRNRPSIDAKALLGFEGPTPWLQRRSGGCNPHGSVLCPGPEYDMSQNHTKSTCFESIRIR